LKTKKKFERLKVQHTKGENLRNCFKTCFKVQRNSRR